jgi:hypothetical protein
MAIVTPTDEAAAIIIRILESIARLNHKTLSARTRDDVLRACELLTQAAGGFDELLDDLSEPPPRSPGEQATLDPNFQRWRAERDRRSLSQDAER